MAANQLLAYGTMPQDPYYPQSEPQGPTFLDTEACVCALRESPAQGSEVKWHCIGNQTDGVYTSTGGKWFDTMNGGGSGVNLPINDASNPPNPEAPHTFNPDSQTLEDVDPARLNVWDTACTAVNHTRFSTTFYRAAAEQSRDEQPISAAPVRFTCSLKWVNNKANFR